MSNNGVKVVVFGIGGYWNLIKDHLTEEINITAYMDNNKSLCGGGVKLPDQWRELDFEKILICTGNYSNKFEMMNQLLDLGVEKSFIGFIEEYQRYYDIDRIEVVDKNTVLVYSENTVVCCENPIEYMIAHEIFAKGDYGLHATGKRFVIDVGMNIGCATLYFAAKEYVTDVYGFEPCKKVYDKALSNIKRNEKDIREKIHTYNIALGGKNSMERYITHSGERESAGIMKVPAGMKSDADTIVEIETVQTSCILKDIFSNHEEKCILKMDCEGAEYDILGDLCNTDEIEKVDIIIMEWHVGKYRELEGLLEKAGFHYLLQKGERDFGKCYAWR